MEVWILEKANIQLCGFPDGFKKLLCGLMACSKESFITDDRADFQA